MSPEIKDNTFILCIKNITPKYHDIRDLRLWNASEEWRENKRSFYLSIKVWIWYSKTHKVQTSDEIFPDFWKKHKLQTQEKNILFAQLRGYDNICLLNANDADVFDFIQVGRWNKNIYSLFFASF